MLKVKAKIFAWESISVQFRVALAIIVGLMLNGCQDSTSQSHTQAANINNNNQTLTQNGQFHRDVPYDPSLFPGSGPKIPTQYSESQRRNIYEIELGSNDMADAEHGNINTYQNEVQHYFGLSDAENLGLVHEAMAKGWVTQDASKSYRDLYVKFRAQDLPHHTWNKAESIASPRVAPKG